MPYVARKAEEKCAKSYSLYQSMLSKWSKNGTFDLFLRNSIPNLIYKLCSFIPSFEGYKMTVYCPAIYSCNRVDGAELSNVWNSTIEFLFGTFVYFRSIVHDFMYMSNIIWWFFLQRPLIAIRLNEISTCCDIHIAQSSMKTYIYLKQKAPSNNEIDAHYLSICGTVTLKCLQLKRYRTLETGIWDARIWDCWFLVAIAL